MSERKWSPLPWLVHAGFWLGLVADGGAALALVLLVLPKVKKMLSGHGSELVMGGLAIGNICVLLMLYPILRRMKALDEMEIKAFDDAVSKRVKQKG